MQAECHIQYYNVIRNTFWFCLCDEPPRESSAIPRKSVAPCHNVVMGDSHAKETG